MIDAIGSEIYCQEVAREDEDPIIQSPGYSQPPTPLIPASIHAAGSPLIPVAFLVGQKGMVFEVVHWVATAKD